MHTCFSTNDVHPRDRFAYWHDVACKILVKHHSQPQNRRIFYAEIRTAAVSDIELVMFENAALSVDHTLQHVRHVEADELFVCRQVAGELALEQAGRGLLLKEGDMTLLDPLMPYSGRFSPDSKLLVLKVQRNALEARVGRTRHVTARLIRPLDGDCSLASTFLGMLPQHAAGLTLQLHFDLRWERYAAAWCRRRNVDHAMINEVGIRRCANFRARRRIS